MHDKIILFDGICNLCNFWVKFIIKRDQHKLLKFASLQSDIGITLIQQKRLHFDKMDTILFLDKGMVYQKSNAVLHICKYLDGPWKLAYKLLFIPISIRDTLYDWVANHRYKWFGKTQACIIPTPEIQTRFLE